MNPEPSPSLESGDTRGRAGVRSAGRSGRLEPPCGGAVGAEPNPRNTCRASLPGSGTPALKSGWYFVWHLFLSKFKFLRELVGDTGSQEGDHEPSGSETEEDTLSSSHRIRSARHRRAPADEGH
ncbi:small integral membrane protein 13 isoform X2 [Canis lupus familiaris]|uniref:small integral membrane protein 13 isoform X2 n=1 Tax=Canis lupus familiaris TaxID=9615 RepID=UPI0018F7DA69|nr:small integral membrane protein 13 isoform X2 [Canis lupus familiaris]